MPIKYVPFIPEPVEGQAVLGNFSRVLKYKGNDDVSGVLKRGMPYYELEKKESVGNNDSNNMVIRGECVSACAYLKDMGVKVDLVYIDPPFASGADYAKKVYIRRNPKVVEAGNQGEENKLDIENVKSFEETMYGDVWDKEKYLNWMFENLAAIKSVMSDTASIYVHLDHHIGHYVKILMDEIFGEENFRNEIVWYYRRWDIKGRTYATNHDTIFWYTKTNNDQYCFNQLYIPKSKKSSAQETSWKSVIDENGNRHSILTDEPTKGVPMPDVWDISMVNPRANQRRDYEYATQKPEELLNRIIRVSSNEGMIVADFFGGSGTTAAVAHNLGRRYIHCDVGFNSIQTTRDRLKSIGASFDVYEIKDGVQLYRNPAQTMEKIKSLIPGLKKEDSLNSFWAGAVQDSKLGLIPVHIPDLKDSFSKLLDKVGMDRIMHQNIRDLPSNVKKVIIYYVDITSDEEIKEIIDENKDITIKIELRDMKSLLDDVVIGDEVEFHVDESHDDLLGGYDVIIDKFLSDRIMGKIDEFNKKNNLVAVSKEKEFKPIEVSDDGLEMIEYLSVDCTANDGEWHSDSEIKIDKLGYEIRDGIRTKEFWEGKIHSKKKPLRLKIRNICGDETVWDIK